jgi:Ca-activated chloride channel family protein
MSLASHRRLILLVALSAIPVSASSQSVERMVYASVLDRAGRPVSGVDAKDLTVRENSIDHAVLRISRAMEPIDIAVMVDTSQDAEAFIPDFRRGLLDFVRVINGRHEVTLIGFGQRPSMLVDYTRDTRRLEAGVARIFVLRGSGAYLMDSIIETSRSLRTRERPRREMIVITSERGELSDRHAADVSGEVQRSGFTLDAFVVVDTQQAVGPASEARVPDWNLPSAAQDQSANERAVALTDAIKRTGGRREDLVTAGMLGAKLRELATRLNNQYRVIYEGPPRLSAPASIEIVSTRSDLRVRVTGIPQNQQP